VWCVALAAAGCSGDQQDKPAPADTAGEQDTDAPQDAASSDTGDHDAGAGGTDTAECAKADDCPDPGGICLLAECAAGKCGTVQAPTGWSCDDGDPCTEKEKCDGGKCEGGKAIDCGDGKACTKDSCEAATGKCVNAPLDGGDCDDGEACTTNDKCEKGVCKGGTNLCDCTEDAQCKDKEDGNPCNGTLFCNKTAAPYKCTINKSTIVKCGSKGTTCKPNVCDVKDGKCKLTPAPDKTPCSDGNACTAGDICAGGACSAGTWTCSCFFDIHCVDKDDGDKCNGTMYCDKGTGACKHNPATVVSCKTAADTQCRKTSCDKKTGLCEALPVADGKVCDDDNACTKAEACTAGVCKASKGANTCVCKSDSDCVAKEDGDTCNGTLFCAKATGTCELNPATVISCPTAADTACSTAQCDKKTGVCALAATATGTACDDGDKCTTGEICEAGLCRSTKAVNTCDCGKDADCPPPDDKCLGPRFCNLATNKCQHNPAVAVVCPVADNTACLQRRCEPVSGACALTVVNQGEACDDGNAATSGDHCYVGQCRGNQLAQCAVDADCAKLDTAGNKCTGTLYCAKGLGTCKVNPGTVVKCNTKDDTACKAARCVPSTGKCQLAPANLFGACKDGDPCTAGEVCNSAGECSGGADLCVCHSDGDCASADDGDLCNGLYFCDQGVTPYFACKPKPASAVSCPPDAGPCQRSACQPKTGNCTQLPLSATACDDGDKCTTATVCDGGACKGDKVDCADGQACTKDLCDPMTGCANPPTGPLPCDDKDACTAKDTCAVGLCKGATVDCDDGNGCTADSCDPSAGSGQAGAKGCVNLPLSSTPCSDDDACTAGDICVVGKCTGFKVTCDDKNTCTVDACDKAKGCVAVPIDGKPCDDGDKCTLNDVCKAAKCAGAAKDCDDGKVCTDDTCDKADGGCKYAFNKAPCRDGDACKAWTCKKGTCREADGYVRTFAGRGSYGSQDGPALDAGFREPEGIVLAADGTMYISDAGNATIRKLSPAGVMTTIAGKPGAKGTADGTGSSARFGYPEGITLIAAGVLAVADTANNRIRRVTDSGVVTTLAGGTKGFADGKGSAARFSNPAGVDTLTDGTIVVGDGYNNRIRRVTPDGVVSTIAGTGQQGSADGPVGSATFYKPYGVGAGLKATVYVCDSGNSTIRRIAAGKVTTIAGTPGKWGFMDGQGAAARFYGPDIVRLGNDGNLYVADDSNAAIRRILSDGRVQTIAGRYYGTGDRLYGDVDGTDALLDDPSYVAIGPAGVIYIADTGNDRIRAWLPPPGPGCDDGNSCTADSCDQKTGKCRHVAVLGACSTGDKDCTMSSCVQGVCKEDGPTLITVAGTGNSGTLDLSDALNAHFRYPEDVLVDAKGVLYVADTSNNRLRRIKLDGSTDTFAGGANHDLKDAVGTAAAFDDPQGMVIDDKTGTLYVADSGNNRIRKVTSGAAVSSFCGGGSTSSSKGTYGEGLAFGARFNAPTDLAWAPDGKTILVADHKNCRLRTVSPDRQSGTLAGGSTCALKDGPKSVARFRSLEALAVDAKGYIWVADEVADAIRRVAQDGSVITPVGGVSGFKDGVGKDARLDAPEGLALVDGGLLIADEGNHALRLLQVPGGDITKAKLTTIAGDRLRGWREGGTIARLASPSGLTSLGGHAWIADTSNHRVTWIQPAAGGCPKGRVCTSGACVPGQ